MTAGPQVVAADARNDVRALVGGLRALRRPGALDRAFWLAFADAAVRLCRGVAGVVAVRGPGGWTTLVDHAEGPGAAPPTPDRAAALMERAAANGFAFERPGGGEGVVVAVLLDPWQAGTAPAAVCLVALPIHGALAPNEALIRLQLAADVPAARSAAPTPVAGTDTAAATMAAVLDVLVVALDQRSFKGAAVALCNEVAARFDCSSVALGWRRGPYVRTVAMSHVGKFERRTEAVRDLEAAMEEAVDQGGAIVWPRPADDDPAKAAVPPVTRAHERLARQTGAAQLLSLPLDGDGRPAAVLVCERPDRPFDDADLRALHLIAGRTAGVLGDLHRRDRWIGARALDRAGEAVRRLLGVERVAPRLVGVAVLAAVAVAALGTWEYRVEAPATVKTDHLAWLPAPFDGYIEGVAVRVGDTVAAGQTLLSLDRTDLLLRETEASADIVRFGRTAEKARAQLALSDMRIAEAQEQQARAQLDRVRFNLRQATLASPIDGVVVEGDRKELLGAPVRKGEVLFKVARLEGLFLELAVAERDVAEIAPGATGRFAFLSRPDTVLPIVVDRIDPVAQVKPEVGNVFVVRARVEGPVPAWARPGMSGLAKIDVDTRPLWWVLGHRTIEVLRIQLWW